MKEVLVTKAKGLNESLARFSRKIADCNSTGSNVPEFSKLICEEMEKLDFDNVSCDSAGNIIGVIKGYQNKGSLALVSHLDIPSTAQERSDSCFKSGMVKFKAGIISSLYGGALIKRTLQPLTGDLVVCCAPRMEACDFGVKHLFEKHLKTRLKKIRGVVLCEPTGFNINLGHKGRMEYEIIVRGRLNRNFLDNQGMNMLGTMFPLISELEKASKLLPSDSNLGYSNLRIKDVRCSGYQAENQLSEFRVIVDRVFIPEENLSGILTKAKTIARDVYKSEPDVTINTALASERVKTWAGADLVLEKELKPWVTESHQPFALDSLESLTDSGFKSSFGYWKKISTDGSYTCAELKIPTIGFGAGTEELIDSGIESLSMDKLERAVYGHALIVQRNIGVPTFGWSSDEI